MKPHPRIRKTIKLVTIAVLVLLVGDWLSAPWWYTSVEVNGCDVGLARGRIEIIRTIGSMNHSPGGWRVDAWDSWAPWQWWFDYGSYSGRRYSSWVLHIPLWLPAIMLVGILVAVHRFELLARRRARLNLCPKCHYDRTGLAIGAKCPECGAAPASV